MVAMKNPAEREITTTTLSAHLRVYFSSFLLKKEDRFEILLRYFNEGKEHAKAFD